MEALVVAAVENKQILTNVPEAKVEKIIASFKAEKAISVTARKQSDGTYTVEAILPS